VTMGVISSVIESLWLGRLSQLQITSATIQLGSWVCARMLISEYTSQGEYLKRIAVKEWSDPLPHGRLAQPHSPKIEIGHRRLTVPFQSL